MKPFARLLAYASKNKDLVGNVAAGSALSAGFGMMAGGPAAGLAYGVGDFATALPLTALARKVRPPKTRRVEVAPGKFEEELLPSRLETAANIGGSLVSPLATEAVAGGLLYPQQAVPTQVSQEQQIMQQMMQRQAINELEVPQAVAPGTQFQAQGIEQTFLDNYRQQVTKMLPNLPPGYIDQMVAMGGAI
jgi:hypothetical protein